MLKEKRIAFIPVVVLMGSIHAMVCGSQGTIWEKSLFSFYQAGPRDQAQVPNLGDKQLYLLSHFAGLENIF